MDIKIITLLMFTVMFAGIGVWVCFRPNAKSHYNKVSNIPLCDDEGGEEGKDNVA